MAMNISINLNDATFSDLVSLVEAAKKAGATAETEISLHDGQLSISVDTTRPAEEDAVPESPNPRTNIFTHGVIDDEGNGIYSAGKNFAETMRTNANQGSDAALRLIAELLKGDRRY